LADVEKIGICGIRKRRSASIPNFMKICEEGYAWPGSVNVK